MRRIRNFLSPRNKKIAMIHGISGGDLIRLVSGRKLFLHSETRFVKQKSYAIGTDQSIYITHRSV